MTSSKLLSIPRDRRHLLALLALALGLAEFADAFFISFWEAGAVFSALFLLGVYLIRRGGMGGPILVGALCVFELVSYPTWERHGLGDWISQTAFAVVAAAGLVVAATVLKQSFGSRRAAATTAASGETG
jgi:GNAT superfamily N-acetyltransferase